MARRTDAPDFVEAIARGFDVITAFGPQRPAMTLSEVAAAAGLARPTARRILLTLEQLGYVRVGRRGVHPHPAGARARHGLRAARSGCGTSPARTWSGWSRAPASRPRSASSTAPTSSTWPGWRCRRSSRCGWRSAPGSRRRRPRSGKVLLAGLPADELDARAGRAVPVRGDPALAAGPGRAGRRPARRSGRKGWALTDEQLAPGIRSVAAPLRDGAGRVIAAMNVTVHAAETSVGTLTGEHLPLLLQAAGDISADFARYQAAPVTHRRGRVGSQRTLVRPTDRRRGGADRPGTAVRPAGGGLLPHPGRAVRVDAAGRPRRRGGQGGEPGRGRHPHLDAADPGRGGRPTTWRINRNKRSVALDLRGEDDAALARELAGRADVVLENFKPGGLARYGLDYDSVAAANPGGGLRVDQRLRHRRRRGRCPATT